MHPSPASVCWVHVSAARPVTPGWSFRAPKCVSAGRAWSGRTVRTLGFSGSGASASDASLRPCWALWGADWAPWRTWTPAVRLRSGIRRWISCRGGCAAAGDGGARRGPAGPPVTGATRSLCHLSDKGLGSDCWGYLACLGDPGVPRSAGQAHSSGRTLRIQLGKVADCGFGAQKGVLVAPWHRLGPPLRPRVSDQKLEGTFAEGNPRCWVSRSGRPRGYFSARLDWDLAMMVRSCKVCCQGWKG